MFLLDLRKASLVPTYFHPIMAKLRHMASHHLVSLFFQGMTCCLMEPGYYLNSMLYNHQLGIVVFTWGQFHRKRSRYLSLISVWKWLIKDHSRIYQGPNESLQWRHSGRESVSNHQPHDCLFNRLFRRRSKKISKLCVTGLCAGNSPVTGEFPTQTTSNAEKVSIWWRHLV